MNSTTEYITEIVQYLEWNGLLLPVALFCSIILLFLVWLLSRSVRLWYWKVNAQVNALSSIDKKLQELGTGAGENRAPAEEPKKAEEIVIEVKMKENTAHSYTEEELDELIRE